MKVQLIISPGEALMVASALDFLRKSMTLNAKSLLWSFEEGDHLMLSTKDLLSLGYVSAALNEACESESNRPHFAGCCRTF